MILLRILNKFKQIVRINKIWIRFHSKLMKIKTKKKSQFRIKIKIKTSLIELNFDLIIYQINTQNNNNTKE